MLGDIEKGRPNLGPMVHAAIYRLMQFTLRHILIRDFGVEKTDRIIFEAGKKAAQEFCENILTEKKDLNGLFADLQRMMKELGIGIFRVESADLEKNSFVVTIVEDLDCSGIPVCSEEICTYDEGFITGLLLAYRESGEEDSPEFYAKVIHPVNESIRGYLILDYAARFDVNQANYMIKKDN
jgi:predicted hydrocarbon binding protein